MSTDGTVPFIVSGCILLTTLVNSAGYFLHAGSLVVPVERIRSAPDRTEKG
jgi:hypothetical protein